MTETPTPAGFLIPRQVARYLGCSVQAVRNWTITGCRVNGHVVTLRCRHVGAKYHIRPEWVEEFVAACSAARQVVVATTPLRYDAAAAERETQAVLAELEEW
ncbi:MAG TPA: hypothetical protein VD866_09520 [Urbifossiella sp.]|nr:hypothetical protein [Urbifossiella sp.]